MTRKLKIEKFLKKYKLKTYKDLKEFKNANKNIKVDLVVVSTPISQHFKNIKETLLIIKPKIILCEKPLGKDLNDAQKIKKLCEKKIANCLLIIQD